MKHQPTRTSKKKNRRQTKKVRGVRGSRRFAFDPKCWGKNKPLEQLWNDLLSYISVVVIYKGHRPYEIVKLQPRPQSQSQFCDQLRAFDSDPQVIAIISAHPYTENAYETLVYPKAKDKTVDYVITNYDRFFKRVPVRMQATDVPIKKLMGPR